MARRFGLRFYRRSQFTLPKSVKVNGTDVPLVYPGEEGVGMDFFGCLIADSYGLRTAKNPMRIADVGANLGFFSIAARAWFPSAQIHAYEPNPRAVDYLRKNTSGLGVDLWTEAVGRSEGWVEIVDGADSNRARTRPSDSGVRQVPLRTVVARMGGHIDLAKIDCEGAEWEMFADPGGWVGIRSVRMEYHLWGVRTFGEVAATMDRLGFDIVAHFPEGQWGTIWADRR